MEKLIPWIWWVESVIVDSLSPFYTRHRISHLEHLNVLWEQIDNCSWVSCLRHNGEDTVKHSIIDRKDHGFNLKWYPTIVNGPMNTICSSKESYHYCSSEWSQFSPMTAEGKTQWEAFGELMVVFKADDSSVDSTGLWTPSCWSAEGLLRPKQSGTNAKQNPELQAPLLPSFLHRTCANKCFYQDLMWWPMYTAATSSNTLIVFILAQYPWSCLSKYYYDMFPIYSFCIV